MKINTLIKLSLIVSGLFFIACNNQLETNSFSHQEAIYWNETIHDIYSDLKAQVAKIETENEDLEAIYKNATIQEPEVLRRIKLHQNTIAEYKNILKKHELILKENQSYLNHHQSSKLENNEIEGQHEQIYRNLILVQKDASKISEQIETVLALYTKLEEHVDS